MRKPTGIYIYLGRELYEQITQKASKKGLTAGEYCRKLVKTEALRSHQAKYKRSTLNDVPFAETLQKGLEDASQGKVSKIDLKTL